jgi:hypothetical protein
VTSRLGTGKTITFFYSVDVSLLDLTKIIWLADTLMYSLSLLAFKTASFGALPIHMCRRMLG